MTNQTDISDPKLERRTVKAGRPRMPISPELALVIERAFVTEGLSQAKIAQRIGISIPRVQRHLVSKGLYRPRPPVRTPERESQVMEAVQAYIDGDKVVEVCETHEINPAELYRELRARNVPFRTAKEELHV